MFVCLLSFGGSGSGSGTNCTYKKPQLTSKQIEAHIYVGTVYGPSP
jgi:hypothetical protein